MRRRSGGILRPAEVVKFALNPETVLHERFEWDDTEAAAQYRLEQARRIIRFTVHVVQEGKPPIRTYVSLESDRAQHDSYRSVVDVMMNHGLRTTLLAQALREAESWRARYEHLAELQPVIRAIAKVSGKGRATQTRKRKIA